MSVQVIWYCQYCRNCLTDAWNGTHRSSTMQNVTFQRIPRESPAASSDIFVASYPYPDRPSTSGSPWRCLSISLRYITSFLSETPPPSVSLATFLQTSRPTSFSYHVATQGTFSTPSFVKNQTAVRSVSIMYTVLWLNPERLQCGRAWTSPAVITIPES